jgi:phenylalanyl-tRNA synthetase beta chain
VLLGADIDRDTMIAGLERLGLSVERSSGALDVLVPSWRPDLTNEDDIAEEVGRIALGYENLPETLPPLRSGRGTDSPRGLFMDRVRESLVRGGLQEAVTNSLTAPSPLATENEAVRRVMVRSALSPELSSLRTSLLPNLLEIAARAHAQGTRDIALFEVAQVYQKAPEGADYPYVEPLRIVGVLAGSAVGQAWAIKPDVLPADFFYTKGVVEDLVAALDLDAASVVFAPGTHPITHPGRTAMVRIGDETVGLVAELNEVVVSQHDLPRRTYVFDLDGDVLRRLAETLGGAAGRVRYSPVPRFPAVVRDLAPVFSKQVVYADIERAAKEAAGPLLEDLRLVDVFEGANLGEGRRSLTLRFTFRSPERTLKDAEVGAALTSVRARLSEDLGADLRG